MNFLPLHVYSGYSFLKSGLLMRKIVGAALLRKYPYVSVADEGSVSGFPELYHLCKDRDLKPIYGMDLWVEGNLFSLFVSNETGYRNLLLLVNRATDGGVDFEFFFAHSDGLVTVLNPDRSFIKADGVTDIDAIAIKLSKIAKRLRLVYLGIPYLPQDPAFIALLRAFTDKYPYPTVAFPHILYFKKEDAISVAILSAIDHNEKLDIKSLSGDQYYLEDEVLASYYTPYELDACMEIAEQLRFEFVIKRGSQHAFPDTEGMNSADFLRKKAYEGLAKRVPNHGQEYVDRLNYELDVIISMGYADYFLIVADYVDWARNHNITVGPSRGSAAGSLVAFALNIVFLDPLQYGLLFERFLNPKRASLPDIDVDFSGNENRTRVANYLREKYGADLTSAIPVTQTMGSDAALQDIGRVFNYPPDDIEIIKESLDSSLPTIKENYKRNQAFKKLLDSDPYYREIASLASKIEGLPRQAGLHPAGVILNSEDLKTCIPIYVRSDGLRVCAYEKDYLEEQGFLKMDLLSLNNLMTIDHCLDLIEATKGIRINARDIPYDDPNAIALIAKGRVMGLFQLESRLMQRIIAAVQPTSFEDVSALIALDRPGPDAFVPTYARRKHGQETTVYPAKALEHILAPTYGIIVYQEQIIQIVREMAGYDFGQADLFRRAIAKKDAAKLASLKVDFLEGCRKNGFKEEESENVFAMIERFANYGFARTHSVGYAVITCQMAYLKYYHEQAFYSTILDKTSISSVEFNAIRREMKQSRIGLKLPDINASQACYYPDGKDFIRIPLDAINGVSQKFALDLLDERELRGPFVDIFDFALRMKKYGLTLPILVRFIDAGAFDSIHPHRASLRLSAGSAIQYAELFSGSDGNAVLLDLQFPKPALKQIADDPIEDIRAEQEALGIMLSKDPLFPKAQIIKEKKLMTIDQAVASPYGGVAAAIIRSVKKITTKKGSKMAFLTIFDQNAEIEVTLFQKELEASITHLQEDNFIQIRIQKDKMREGSFIGSEIQSL